MPITEHYLQHIRQIHSEFRQKAPLLQLLDEQTAFEELATILSPFNYAALANYMIPADESDPDFDWFDFLDQDEHSQAYTAFPWYAALTDLQKNLELTTKAYQQEGTPSPQDRIIHDTVLKKFGQKDPELNQALIKERAEDETRLQKAYQIIQTYSLSTLMIVIIEEMTNSYTKYLIAAAREHPQLTESEIIEMVKQYLYTLEPLMIPFLPEENCDDE